MIYGLIAMLGWGMSNFVAAQLSKKIGALNAVFWNTVGVFVFMLLGLPLFRQDLLLASWNDFFILMVAGGFLAIGGIAFYKGTSLGKVSLVSPLSASWPIVVAVITLLINHETPNALKILALLLIFVGGLVASLKITKSTKIFSFSDPGIPYALLALGAWSFAFYLFGITLVASPWLTANVYFVFWASLVTFAYGIRKRVKFSFTPYKSNIKLFLLFTITASCASIAYSLGVRSLQATLTAAITNANPAVTTLLAWILIRERLTWLQKGGILSIVAGLIVLSL